MADLDELTLESEESQRQAATQVRRQQVASRQQARGPSRVKQQAEATGEKAISALQHSPAAANIWVRGILLVNNLINRMTGRPPNSAENLTVGAQLVAVIVVLNVLMHGAVLLVNISIVGTVVTRPDLAVKAAILFPMCWISQYFNPSHQC